MANNILGALSRGLTGKKPPSSSPPAVAPMSKYLLHQQGPIVGGQGASGGNRAWPASAIAGAAGAAQQSNANLGAPQQGTRGKPSDARFRSFAERFMIARAHLFRNDPVGLQEDTWECIMDAKRAYRMIERTGQNIEPEEGAGF
jgi:hypothetical protein